MHQQDHARVSKAAVLAKRGGATSSVVAASRKQQPPGRNSRPNADTDADVVAKNESSTARLAQQHIGAAMKHATGETLPRVGKAWTSSADVQTQT